MSLSEYASTSFTLGGYATKPSKISLLESDPSSKQGAVESLRAYFARRRDLAGKDVLLTEVDAYLREGGQQKGFEIVGDLTRKQRKDARLLGFAVHYAG